MAEIAFRKRVDGLRASASRIVAPPLAAYSLAMENPDLQRPQGSSDIKITIYGCRGSVPVNGREFDKYGGSTSCALVTYDDAVNIGIIDAGTGIRHLGRYLMEDPLLR